MMRSTISLGDEVGDAEEGAGDDDEAEHDRGGLADLTAVRPLHALELGPAGPQEVDEAAAAAAAGVLASGAAAPRAAGARSAASRRRPSAVRLVAAVAATLARRRRRPGRLGLAVGAGDDRRLELVDVAGVLDAGPGRSRGGCALGLGRHAGAARRAWTAAGLAALLALLRALTVAGHGPSRATGSPGGWCASGTTCSTCAARCDPGCCAWTCSSVVAPLALLAGEGDSDAHVSAGHGPAPSGAGQKTTRRAAGRTWKCSALAAAIPRPPHAQPHARSRASSRRRSLCFLAVGAVLPVLPRYVTGPLGGGDVAVGHRHGRLRVHRDRRPAVRRAPRRPRAAAGSSCVAGLVLAALAGALYFLPLGVPGLVARAARARRRPRAGCSPPAWRGRSTSRRSERRGQVDRALRARRVGRAVVRAARSARRSAHARLATSRVGVRRASRRWSARRSRARVPDRRAPRPRRRRAPAACCPREAVRPGRRAASCASVGYATLAGFVVLHLDELGVGARRGGVHRVRVDRRRRRASRSRWLPDRVGPRATRDRARRSRRRSG